MLDAVILGQATVAKLIMNVVGFGLAGAFLYPFLANKISKILSTKLGNNPHKTVTMQQGLVWGVATGVLFTLVNGLLGW